MSDEGMWNARKPTGENNWSPFESYLWSQAFPNKIKGFFTLCWICRQMIAKIRTYET
jgi:hypothetical protein